MHKAKNIDFLLIKKKTRWSKAGGGPRQGIPYWISNYHSDPNQILWICFLLKRILEGIANVEQKYCIEWLSMGPRFYRLSHPQPKLVNLFVVETLTG